MLGLEVIIRFIDPTLTDGFSPEAREALRIHLFFAVPSALCIPAMWLLGWYGRKRMHLGLSVIFSLAWVGTIITGLIFLPHDF